MNHFSLLVKLTEQMYQDIKFVAENNPTQVVDDESTRMFNAVLTQMREARPQLSVLNMFSDMNPRTLKYKDALVVTGQLKCLAHALNESNIQFDSLINTATSEAKQNEKAKANTSEKKDGKTHAEKPEALGESEALDESMDDSNKVESYVDEELYGTKSLRVNEEGIVPFDLSDS
ncbi:MAG: hypothetical protein ACFCU1_01685 [Sumerlaeia bacterium]